MSVSQYGLTAYDLDYTKQKITKQRDALYETIDDIKVTRIPEWFRFMRYAVSPGMIPHLNNFDILHAHNYRNFQTDCGFFLPN